MYKSCGALSSGIEARSLEPPSLEVGTWLEGGEREYFPRAYSLGDFIGSWWRLINVEGFSWGIRENNLSNFQHVLILTTKL